MNFLNKRLMARMSAAAPGSERGEGEKQKTMEKKRKTSKDRRREEEEGLGSDGWVTRNDLVGGEG